MGLLIRESAVTSGTKIGGLPTGVQHIDWPTCRSCKGSMQFIAQIRLEDSDNESLKVRPEVLLIFQCQNDPGMCDDWDASGGGNAAILAPIGSDTIEAPETGETTLSQQTFVSLTPCDVDGSTEADHYMDAVNSDSAVLGKIGGEPLWIQSDETPACSCGNPMQFVALLEERGGGGLNFGGGGIGYAFVCSACPGRAKFLWQS